MILKPLNPDYQLVTLGVTDIESKLYPVDYHATEEQLFEAAVLGHACGSIIQHTAINQDGLCGQYVNEMYREMLSYLQDSKSAKSRTFYKNIINGNIAKIGNRYQGIVQTETPLYLRIEAGKYLLFIKSGGLDMAGLTDESGIKIVYDNKLYSSYFKDAEGKVMGTKYNNTDKECEIETKKYDGKIYTVDETLQSELGSKIQWWMYPLMYGFKDYIYFQYNVVVKNEAKEKNLMPNVQEIRIKIYREEAEKLLRQAIVEIFKNHFNEQTLKLIGK